MDARSSVKVNNAIVQKTDIMAGNGVIHVTDTVILPPDLMSAVDAGRQLATY